MLLTLDDKHKKDILFVQQLPPKGIEVEWDEVVDWFLRFLSSILHVVFFVFSGVSIHAGSDYICLSFQKLSRNSARLR